MEQHRAGSYHFYSFYFPYLELCLWLRASTNIYRSVFMCETWIYVGKQIIKMQCYLKSLYTLISARSSMYLCTQGSPKALPRGPGYLSKIQSQPCSSRNRFNFSAGKQIIKYMKTQGPLLTILLFHKTYHSQGYLLNFFALEI